MTRRSAASGCGRTASRQSPLALFRVDHWGFRDVACSDRWNWKSRRRHLYRGDRLAEDSTKEEQ